MKSLLQYDWPGNVRELGELLARAVTLGDHEVMDVKDLPPAIRTEQPAGGGCGRRFRSASLPTTALAEMERMTILRVSNKRTATRPWRGKCLASAGRPFTGS